MSIYYDPEKEQIHGMLTVRNEDGSTWWLKYHNIARVTREQPTRREDGDFGR